MPAWVPLAIMGAGALLKSYGQIKSNKDQAEAERANAEFFREQAKFAEEAGKRAESIFESQVHQLKGEQLSVFAKAGVDLSGSALTALMETETQKHREILAIRREKEMNVRLAMMRSRSADELADNLSSFKTNALQTGGTILTTAGLAYGRIS